MNMRLPRAAQAIANTLLEAGADVYVVGGFVRDTLMRREPKDCDLATNFTPAGVMQALGNGYTVIQTGIKYGTITALTGGDNSPVEITTLRADGVYTDGRRPSSVVYTDNVYQDLLRRDFTMNAMAYDVCYGVLIDPHGGVRDIASRRIACVGWAEDRFNEDALRMMRAFRFMAQLPGFYPNHDILVTCHKHAALLEHVSRERVRDELLKTLAGPAYVDAVDAMMQAGLMRYVIPQLCALVNYDQQSKYHELTAWDHTLQALRHTPNDPILRLAVLLHDIAKPQCRSFGGDGFAHYYGHEEHGAIISEEVCHSLRLSTVDTERVVGLVRNHLRLLGNPLTERHVRRLIAEFGVSMLHDMLRVYRADRCGHVVHTSDQSDIVAGQTYAAVHEMIDRIAQEQPCTQAQLALNGHHVMQITGLSSGPQVGAILRLLHELVLENPVHNTPEYLEGVVAGFRV